MRKPTRYVEVRESQLPPGLRFVTPRHNQGQIVEVSYADHPGARDEPAAGDPWKRVEDRSGCSVRYYRRVDA